MSLRLRRRRDATVGLEPGTTLPDRHHFATRFVQRAAAEGTLSIGKGKITLHLDEGDAEYVILRTPGAYCLHCGERIGDGPAATPAEAERRRHYVEHCEKSPEGTLEGPDAYEVIDFFDTELEE